MNLKTVIVVLIFILSFLAINARLTAIEKERCAVWHWESCQNKYMKTQRVPKYEEVRNKKIYELSKIRGNSYNQIARSYDITPQRVGQIVNNYKKRLENQP